MNEKKVAQELTNIAKLVKTAGSTEQRELELYIVNDGDLYRQQVQPIIKNLKRKAKRGVYDATKAVKLWMYLVDAGAKKYVNEFGSAGDKWHEMFPKRDRQAVAEELREYYEEEIMEDVTTASSRSAGCDKLPEGPMRDNCEKKKKEKGDSKEASRRVSAEPHIEQIALLVGQLMDITPSSVSNVRQHDTLERSLTHALSKLTEPEGKKLLKLFKEYMRNFRAHVDAEMMLDDIIVEMDDILLDLTR